MRIHELTFDNTGQWPRTIKLGFLFGLGGLIFAFGYWFLIQKEFDLYTSLKLQERALKSEFAAKKFQMLHLVSDTSPLQQIQKDFERMLKAFPHKNEMTRILDDLSRTGMQAGLQFTLFAPQKEKAHGFFIELPIKISFRGTYSQLAQFLMEVAQMTQLVTFHEFKIEVVSSLTSYSNSNDELDMTVLTKTYCYQNPR